MEFLHFKAGNDDDGRRFDKILRRFLAEDSLSQLYKSLRKGLVKLNGKKAEGNARVSAGDDIQIAAFLAGKELAENGSASENAEDSANFTGAHKKASEPEETKCGKPLDEKLVLLRNEDFLIINKPYDVPVQPAASNEESVSALIALDYDFFHQEKTSLSFKCGPLHRLDKKTTGILVCSQSLKGARWFSRSIREHSSRKTYLGLCQGTLQKTELWKDSIQKVHDGGKENSPSSFHTVRIENSPAADAKEAVTHAKPLAHGILDGIKVTLVEYVIETGRTHQIRSQTSHHGFPLLGDVAYGGRKIDSSFFGQDFFLHAYKLGFPENRLQSLPEEMVCPISEDFKKILKASLINGF